MTIDRTAIADRIIADWGESMSVRGQSFTATFTIGGGARRENAPEGEENLRRASMSFKTGAIELIRDEVVTRAADNTLWTVADLQTAGNGMTVCDLTAVDRLKVGKL
jgi:hypothetical protein